MPLVYLPDRARLFLWGPTRVAGLNGGVPERAALMLPEGPREVDGAAHAPLDALPALAALPSAELDGVPASVATWSLASKLALDLVARERVVPTLAHRGGRVEARWAAAFASSEDAAQLAALARSMPPSAHAVPVTGGVWAPEALLRAYVDAVVDGLLRRASPREATGLSRVPAESARASLHEATGLSSARSLREARGTKAAAWQERWRDALTGGEPAFEAGGFAERGVAGELERWSEPAVGAGDRLRACFRLALPPEGGDTFALRFLLQSPDDPSLLVEASEVWRTRGRQLAKLGRAFRDPQESLLAALGRASRLFPPLEAALAEARPESLALDPPAAWAFLGEGAAALAEAGFGVIVPGELTAAGQRRLRLRMRVGGKGKGTAGTVAGAASIGLAGLLDVNWDAVIGDETLSARDLEALARQKSGLVRHRGAWVAIDPSELAGIRERLARGPTRMAMGEAIRAALAGEARQGDLVATVTAGGALAELLDRLRGGADATTAVPPSLRATLRPYQVRGLAWLSTMASLRLGACLADDMGLGKTVQLLAFLLRRWADEPRDRRPALLVAPTSVVGNWEREAERFAPSLHVVAHHGAERARSPAELPDEAGALVLTTYGLLRRDAALLGAVDWSVVVLDEAQNIKNAASATARAACALRADHRFALTGTPVENRLAELWSILEFANPGLLGPLETFRREVAVPIERHGNADAAARLKRLVAPFLLRRVKSDPSVIADLPPKNEMKVYCTLTREQATLYKAVVDVEMERIAGSDGMERRGRVLALLMALKQICNHPAQYLSQSGPLPGRSGKLARLGEMLEEAVAAGDKVLVFTQFREMGDRLVRHLEETLGCAVMFLHGGTRKAERDEQVRAFQEDARGPPIFVLSLKAGGTGLNLTAASHVFHFDRWWNPAVEDQATDRAWRIGQKRAVQVHKLLCGGTVEEKIDAMLEQKRSLAAKVVGAGEQWITEMGDADLRDLFALGDAVVDEADA